MRAVAYIRVSDASQVDGHSLDAQERLFLELCQNRGWVPAKVYREEGRSAHTDSIAKRPVFRQLLEHAAQGQFDVVVVHTLDRWARNLKVMLETVALLSQHGVGLVSITENLDWSTAEGRLVARTLGSFGEFFSDMLLPTFGKASRSGCGRAATWGASPLAMNPAGRRSRENGNSSATRSIPPGFTSTLLRDPPSPSYSKGTLPAASPWGSWPTGSTFRGSAPATLIEELFEYRTK